MAACVRVGAEDNGRRLGGRTQLRALFVKGEIKDAVGVAAHAVLLVASLQVPDLERAGVMAAHEEGGTPSPAQVPRPPRPTLMLASSDAVAARA